LFVLTRVETTRHDTTQRHTMSGTTSSAPAAAAAAAATKTKSLWSSTTTTNNNNNNNNNTVSHTDTSIDLQIGTHLESNNNNTNNNEGSDDDGNDDFDDDDDDEAPMLIALGPHEGEAQGEAQPDIDHDNDHLNDNDNDINDNINDRTPCPVTILSGFLGSGKTTLVQHILKSPNHGRRIAVIENEFGQGLSVESIIARDGLVNDTAAAAAGSSAGSSALLTDLIELPNGCVCCTVKDSLVSTLEALIEKRNDLDYILIECSGMANPGPIASIFWLDDAHQSRLKLDGIITLVDARNIVHQLHETEEASQQIAYADRILLNKIDLVVPNHNNENQNNNTDNSSSSNNNSSNSNDDDDQLERIRQCIRNIHPTAPIRETTYSQVYDLDWILGVNCYDQTDNNRRLNEVTERLLMEHSLVSSFSSSTTITTPSSSSFNTTAATTTANKNNNNEKNGGGGRLQFLLGNNINNNNNNDNSTNWDYCQLISTPIPPVEEEVEKNQKNVNGNRRNNHLQQPRRRWQQERQQQRHSHTEAVSTVALIIKGSVHLQKINSWLASLLWPNQDEKDSILRAKLEREEEPDNEKKEDDDNRQSNGNGNNDNNNNNKNKNAAENDAIPSTTTTFAQHQKKNSNQQQQQQIFRIKGILSVRHSTTATTTTTAATTTTKDSILLEEEEKEFVNDDGVDERRYIVQAVYDLWDVHPGSGDCQELRWAEGEERCCKLVVIGRYLQESDLRTAFRSCATS